MNIDPTTNNLYIADVGQNAHEEVDEYVYTMGNLQLVNFGWPWKEGNFNYSSCSGGNPGGLIDPIVDVPQSQGWGSIMSGPRYRSLGGPYDFGMSYDGSVFYSDYFSGQLRRLVQSGSNWIPAPAVPGQPSATNWATGFSALTSFQQGPDGALYLTQHSSTYSWSGGTLKRIRVLGPVNTVNSVSGDGQVGIAQESFAQPLVVQVLDPMGSPLAGGSVNFSVTGPATLGTTNPVIADASGFAQTTVAATNFGGAVTVTAMTPGAGASATFNLYARNLGIVAGPTFVLVQVQNQSTAAPPTVPYAILISIPGIPPLATPIGPICTDPFNPVTLVLEDSIGLFNFVSLSGTGAVGNPGLVKLYNIPLNSLLGVTLSFQAVGLDPVEGLVRTDCETFAF